MEKFGYDLKHAFICFYGSLEDAEEEIKIFNEMATIDVDFARFMKNYIA
jgi:hypothetical protein